MDRRTFIKATLATGLSAPAILDRFISAAASAGTKVLRIGYGTPVQTLDPIKTVLGSDIISQGMMFSRLMKANADQSEIGPGLAESWKISEDGLTYTFHLRDGLKFSDGSPLTADDVAFTYNRMRFQADSVYAAPFKSLQKIEAADARTVRMGLSHPFPAFLKLCEIWNTGIVSKASVKALGDEKFGSNPTVTSGPFKFVEWRAGDRVIMARNENFYLSGHPRLDGIEFISVSDDNTGVAMVQAGELDVVMGVPYSRMKELETAGVKVASEPSSATYDMLINHETEPFSNVKFRQAVSFGIDRRAITDAVTAGYGKPASSIFSPMLEFFDKDLPVIARDVEKAKTLLASSGMAPSFELMTNAGATDEDKLAILIQAQLAEVGITVTIQSIDSGQAWTQLVDGKYQAQLNWWYNETTDPDNALRWCAWGAGENKSYYTRFNNAEVNALIESAAAEVDQAKRDEMYKKIQRICVEEVAQVALYHPTWTSARAANVTGLAFDPGCQYSTIEEADLKS
ncbi:ABC transporter substrate-binding protein [Mesorhizobium sp. M4A.F.Ca.ET.022.05.2.1]|uniref:ABC transporter substrate-binding protein n=1 Tax=unclassified Mesorhizobium TaxID=325217 RepID=UPI000FCC7A78|nr:MULTISPECIES: ABC transporter substrate-binding protein [unclassified Mesorhizobium]RVC76852.1 ABC transporter substrate-binding protein [Mesorhizobium sp. M4A.F.Ca.ET.022.05.2.1]RVD70663.1 ABC transporter substrate-binding protein [Mesorhizobium sp. M4A.F.Ca.ET.029.04.2.1]TIW37458.1 MAG: ABC transporter substrate-binding protein [Mesorhizobium sp.]